MSLQGKLSAAALILNDWSLEVSDIPGGHRLTATRGTEVQTLDVMDGGEGMPEEELAECRAEEQNRRDAEAARVEAEEARRQAFDRIELYATQTADGAQLTVVNTDGEATGATVRHGISGKSAYQYAADGGFAGTEAEFAQLQADAVLSAGKAQQALSDMLKMMGSDVATLVDGKVPMEQIPATATQEIYEVSSADALTALAAQRGDLAELVEEIDGVRTVTRSWQLLGDDPSIAGNWVVWGTSYAVQAGSAATAGEAENAAAINGHRLVQITSSEWETAVKDPDTYYLVYDAEASV